MDTRRYAATTPQTMIAKGSPAEAYQAINRAKMLWSFRRRDVNDWKEVIDRWTTEPKAWKRVPETKPYGTPRAMIEAEVCENYDAFVNFVEVIIGADYAAKLSDNHADRPGRAMTQMLGTDTLLNDTYINSLSRCISSIKSAENIPALVKAAIEKEMWRYRIVGQTKQAACFDTFQQFVEAPAPEGLNTTIDRLIAICRFVGADDVALMLAEMAE